MDIISINTENVIALSSANLNTLQSFYRDKVANKQAPVAPIVELAKPKVEEIKETIPTPTIPPVEQNIFSMPPQETQPVDQTPADLLANKFAINNPPQSSEPAISPVIEFDSTPDDKIGKIIKIVEGLQIKLGTFAAQHDEEIEIIKRELMTMNKQKEVQKPEPQIDTNIFDSQAPTQEVVNSFRPAA